MPMYCGLEGPKVASALRMEDWSCRISTYMWERRRDELGCNVGGRSRREGGGSFVFAARGLDLLTEARRSSCCEDMVGRSVKILVCH